MSRKQPAPDPPQPDKAAMIAAGCLDEYGWHSEAHEEHMRINGDCPWFGAYNKRKWLGGGQ